MTAGEHENLADVDKGLNWIMCQFLFVSVLSPLSNKMEKSKEEN